MNIPWMLARGAVNYLLYKREDRILTEQDGPLREIDIHTSMAYANVDIARRGLTLPNAYTHRIFVAIQRIAPETGPTIGWLDSFEQGGISAVIHKEERNRRMVNYLVCAFDQDFKRIWGGPHHTMRVVLPKKKGLWRGSIGEFELIKKTPAEPLKPGEQIARVPAILMGDGPGARSMISLWPKKRHWHPVYRDGRKPLPHDAVIAKSFKWPK
ncbi:hypothetical protein ABT299_50615 [Spirillospora sp. NPDC000708]